MTNNTHKDLIDKINSIKQDLVKLGDKYAIFFAKVLCNLDITRDEKKYELKIKEMREGKIPEGFPQINDDEFETILIDQLEQHHKWEIEARRNVSKILPEDEETNERWMQLLREMSGAVEQLSTPR